MAAVYSYEYDSSYIPAAPQVSIYLCQEGKTEDGVTVKAMVDSGADATMIPENTLEQINAPQSDTAFLRGVTGNRIEIGLHKVAVRIGPVQLPKIAVVAIEAGGEPLIGRDILNYLSVRLDGPAQVVEVSE